MPPSRVYPGTPRWVKVTAILAVLIALLLGMLLHALGHGQSHGLHGTQANRARNIEGNGP
jgi:hypothetical protein